MATLLYAQWSRKVVESVLDLSAFNDRVPRGRCWKGRRLVLMALWQDWQGDQSLAQRFQTGLQCLRKACRPRGLIGSYTGWMDALVGHSPELLAELKAQLRRQILRDLPAKAPLVLAWVADGTRRNCPRTPANERAFGPGGKPNGPPQLLTTALVHLGSGQWWDWVSGPAHQDEKAQLGRMLATLPPESILVLDAYYATEALLRQILNLGLHVVVRACGNVRLLAPDPIDAPDRNLWLWPPRAQRQGQGPLELRRIVLGQGEAAIAVLTDLPAERLSGAQAGELFANRWQIETDWRDLKMTLGLAALRSRSPERALCEADWAIASLAVLERLTARHVRRRGEDPLRMSVAKARTAVRKVLEQPGQASRDNPLSGPLSRAVRDRYVRRGPKQTRPPVRKKHRRCPGPPKLRLATPQELQRAAQLARDSPAA